MAVQQSILQFTIKQPSRPHQLITIIPNQQTRASTINNSARPQPCSFLHREAPINSQLQLQKEISPLLPSHLPMLSSFHRRNPQGPSRAPPLQRRLQSAHFTAKTQLSRRYSCAPRPPKTHIAVDPSRELLNRRCCN
ncbi:hypothetical protein M0R45_017117 [Rubus argutus]|uniref:Uncharacterized protein n=1 Tax=Rubus argutus TaxID=59490 RepID=A0AAW1XX24_RUBAR